MGCWSTEGEEGRSSRGGRQWIGGKDMAGVEDGGGCYDGDRGGSRYTTRVRRVMQCAVCGWM